MHPSSIHCRMPGHSATKTSLTPPINLAVVHTSPHRAASVVIVDKPALEANSRRPKYDHVVCCAAQTGCLTDGIGGASKEGALMTFDCRLCEDAFVTLGRGSTLRHA